MMKKILLLILFLVMGVSPVYAYDDVYDHQEYWKYYNEKEQDRETIPAYDIDMFRADYRSTHEESDYLYYLMRKHKTGGFTYRYHLDFKPERLKKLYTSPAIDNPYIHGVDVLGYDARLKTIDFKKLTRQKGYIRRIGANAFAHTKLTSITVPDSVEYVGKNAFGSLKVKKSPYLIKQKGIYKYYFVSGKKRIQPSDVMALYYRGTQAKLDGGKSGAIKTIPQKDTENKSPSYVMTLKKGQSVFLNGYIKVKNKYFPISYKQVNQLSERKYKHYVKFYKGKLTALKKGGEFITIVPMAGVYNISYAIEVKVV